MKLVIVESPYAGQVDLHILYARMCLRDCLLRDEAPFASHLLYTQPGVLLDEKPEDRKLGMEAGWNFMRRADLVAVYSDLGLSEGMNRGIEACQAMRIPFEHRYLFPGITKEEIYAVLKSEEKR